MKKNTTYQKAIDALPQHKASEDLWLKVGQRLDNESDLSLLLPQHKADARLWKSIKTALDLQQRRHNLNVFLKWSAAAAVLLLLFIPLRQTELFKIGDKMITSEEMIIPFDGKLDEALNLEDDILTCCTQNPEVCESPDFNNLNTMLNQLKTEKTQLIEMSKEMNDPSINNYIQKININIAQVQRKLLSMF